MVNYNYYKCNICGKVSMLRRQMGYLHDYDINYRCICGITIKGHSHEDVLKFENATHIDSEEYNEMADQVVEVSTEFLCKKPFKANESIEEHESIFIRNVDILDYSLYKKEFEKLIDFKQNLILKIQNINELYELKKYDLLKQEIIKYFDIIQNRFSFSIINAYPLTNDFEYMRAIYFINISIFLDKKNISDIDNIRNKTVNLFIEKTQSMYDFIKYLSDKNLIELYRKKLFKVYKLYTDMIDKLLPVVSIDYYYNDVGFLFNGDYVITTISFEDIKNLYQDVFEWFTSSCSLIVGLDNIIKRNKYNDMRVSSEKVKNYRSLDKIQNETAKRSILNYIYDCSDDDFFEKLFFHFFDAVLRNSIGHFNYEDTSYLSLDKQEVVFNNNKNGINTEIRVNYIKFIYFIWNFHNAIIYFTEILYNLEKICKMNENISIYKPIYNLNFKINKKIYPNDSCPCGSGLKYKKCCGKCC